jgi:hypothetical protein
MGFSFFYFQLEISKEVQSFAQIYLITNGFGGR